MPSFMPQSVGALSINTKLIDFMAVLDAREATLTTAKRLLAATVAKLHVAQSAF